MRCISCNNNLNDSESTRKIASTGEYLDMCNRCYSDISTEVPTISRPDLDPTDNTYAGCQDEWEDCEVEE